MDQLSLLWPAHLHQCLPPVLAPDVMLVTDGHAAYPAFGRLAGISRRAVNLSAGVRVATTLHVQNVNAYHGRFKGWRRRFNGVASRYLPNYLGWRWALDGGVSVRRKCCSERHSAPPRT